MTKKLTITLIAIIVGALHFVTGECSVANINQKNQILEEENIKESVIASDSTGFSPGQASLYYQTRSGRTYEHWIKGAYAVGQKANTFWLGNLDMDQVMTRLI